MTDPVSLYRFSYIIGTASAAVKQQICLYQKYERIISDTGEQNDRVIPTATRKNNAHCTLFRVFLI